MNDERRATNPSNKEPGSSESCSRLHVWVSRAVLLGVILTVIPTGLALPLGHWEWSVWPWKKAWFMFGSDTGYQYERQFIGHYGPDEQDVLDLSEWFALPVGHHGRRFDEVRRDTATMQRLADYICTRWNEAAASGERRRLVAVSVEDHYWQRPAGRVRTVEEMPPGSVRLWPWVARRRCDVSRVPGG